MGLQKQRAIDAPTYASSARREQEARGIAQTLARNGTAAESTRSKVAPKLSVPDWIALIRRLRDEGRTDEAAKELAAFRDAYADPNTLLPSRCDNDFLALLPKGLRSYIEDDRSVTILMLAAGLGQVNYLQPLMDGGANRTRLTSRNKMSALDVAAETGHWRSAQILLGGGPAPEKLRIEISLAMQSVALVRDGVPIYHARCSTGRSGYSTKRGEFVITNKERNHRSTIYHVEMPYFMRLSCLDFGMHAGYVPNYPASHGCIRLPEDTARKFFSEIPVGTLVTVQ